MKTVIPILPHVGGVLDPKNIVGRKDFIETFWIILQSKGISLFAERRFGKSCVIRKMHHQGQKGFTTIYKSVQGINTPENFVDALFEYAKEHKLFSEGILGKIEEAWNAWTSHVPQAIGMKFSKDNITWQKKLTYLIEQILDSNPKQILIIFLDEFSLMLDDMESSDAALVLGTLRDIVHDPFSRRLRFVYTGSIGIDLIIDKIKANGHNLGDPQNHLEKK